MSEASIILARVIGLVVSGAIDDGTVVLNGPSTISQLESVIEPFIRRLVPDGIVKADPIRFVQFDDGGPLMSGDPVLTCELSPANLQKSTER